MQQPKELNFLGRINGLLFCRGGEALKHADEPVPMADLLSLSAIKRHPSCVPSVTGQHDLRKEEKIK